MAEAVLTRCSSDPSPGPSGGRRIGSCDTHSEPAIDGLAPTLRTAFVLREVEGLSTAEAASLLEISEAALKVRLHRARIALRCALEQRAGEAVGALYAFGAERCDRMVAAVLRRVAP